MWCRPEPSSVSPIYMPGRLRTGSRPCSTLIECSSYSIGRTGSEADGFAIIGFGFSLQNGFGQTAVGDRQKAGGATQWREQGGLGAGDPGLAVEPGQHLEQRSAAHRIEMGGDLVEQQ